MINVRVVVAGGVGSVAASALGLVIAGHESFIHISVPGQAEATALLVWLSSHGYEVLNVTREPIPVSQADLPHPRSQDQPARPGQ